MAETITLTIPRQKNIALIAHDGKKAELIILLLDLMACPFLRAKDREKICGYMDIGGKKQQRIEKYLSKKKYMFTRWTSVNLTKELGAKVSLEVYS